jgi:hypothetical protein
MVAVEVAWRWGFWAATAALGLGTLLLWLDSIPISSTDLRNLRAGPPWLVAVTMVRVLSNAYAHLKVALLLCLLGSLLIWWMIGSVVRARCAVSFSGHLTRNIRRMNPRDFGVMLAYHASWFLVTGSCLLIADSILERAFFRSGAGPVLSQAAFLSGAVGIAALLLFWQLFSWLLCLGCSYAVAQQTDFLAGFGLSLAHLGESMLEFLAFATTFFLFRCATFVAGLLSIVLLVILLDLDRKTALLWALPLGAVFVSIPCRFLATARSAGYLALTGLGSASATAAPEELPS